MDEDNNLTSEEFKKKTIKIFIHGFLHLLGYNHLKDKDFKKMLKAEKKVFNSVKKFIKSN